MTTPETEKIARIEETVESLKVRADALEVYVQSLGEVLCRERPELALKLRDEVLAERKRICDLPGGPHDAFAREITLLMPPDQADLAR